MQAGDCRSIEPLAVQDCLNRPYDRYRARIVDQTAGRPGAACNIVACLYHPRKIGCDLPFVAFEMAVSPDDNRREHDADIYAVHAKTPSEIRSSAGLHLGCSPGIVRDVGVAWIFLRASLRCATALPGPQPGALLFRFGATVTAWCSRRKCLVSALEANVFSPTRAGDVYGVFDASGCRPKSGSAEFYDRIHTRRLMSVATADVDNVCFVVNAGLLGLVDVLVRHWARIQALTADLTVVLQDSLARMWVVKAFAAEDYERSKYDRRASELRSAFVGMLRMQAMHRAWRGMYFALMAGAVMWWGGLMVVHGTITLGELVTFVSYLLLLAAQIRGMGRVIGAIPRGVTSAQCLFGVLDAPAPVEERPGGIDPGRVAGRVRCDDVVFGYERSSPVLRGLSLEVKPGEVAVITGGRQRQDHDSDTRCLALYCLATCNRIESFDFFALVDNREREMIRHFGERKRELHALSFDQKQIIPAAVVWPP